MTVGVRSSKRHPLPRGSVGSLVRVASNRAGKVQVPADIADNGREDELYAVEAATENGVEGGAMDIEQDGSALEEPKRAMAKSKVLLASGSGRTRAALRRGELSRAPWRGNARSWKSRSLQEDKVPTPRSAAATRSASSWVGIAAPKAASVKQATAKRPAVKRLTRSQYAARAEREAETGAIPDGKTSAKECGQKGCIVDISNVPADYDRSVVDELHEAMDLDPSSLVSATFMPGDAEGNCKVCLLYKDHNSAIGAVEALHGQKVASAKGRQQALSAELRRSSAAIPMVLPSIVISDVPKHYNNETLLELLEHVDVDATALVSATFLPTEGDTCYCIARFRDQEMAEVAEGALNGQAVETKAGEIKYLAAKLAKARAKTPDEAQAPTEEPQISAEEAQEAQEAEATAPAEEEEPKAPAEQPATEHPGDEVSPASVLGSGPAVVGPPLRPQPPPPQPRPPPAYVLPPANAANAATAGTPATGATVVPPPVGSAKPGTSETPLGRGLKVISRPLHVPPPTWRPTAHGTKTLAPQAQQQPTEAAASAPSASATRAPNVAWARPAVTGVVVGPRFGGGNTPAVATGGCVGSAWAVRARPPLPAQTPAQRGVAPAQQQTYLQMFGRQQAALVSAAAHQQQKAAFVSAAAHQQQKAAFVTVAAHQQQQAAHQQQQQAHLATSSVAANAAQGASSSSLSSGPLTPDKAMDQAVAAYAEQELHKFVDRLHLSKATEEALRSLTPELMLTVTDDLGADDSGVDKDGSTTNADGAEDAVVMARIARIREDAATGETSTISAAMRQRVNKAALQALSGPQHPEEPKKGTIVPPPFATNFAETEQELAELLERFVNENGLGHALELRLKELSPRCLKFVTGKPGSSMFRVKGSFSDPNAEVLTRIERSSKVADPMGGEYPTALGKEAKEVEAEIRTQIGLRSHTIDFAQTIVNFASRHGLDKEVEWSLLMLSSTQARAIMEDRSLFKASDDKAKKQETVLSKVNFVDRLAHGLIKKFRRANTKVNAVAAVVKEKEQKRPADQERSRSRDASKKRRSRSKCTDRRDSKQKAPNEALDKGGQSSRKRRGSDASNQRCKTNKSKPRKRARRSTGSSASSGTHGQSGKRSTSKLNVAGVEEGSPHQQEPSAPSAPPGVDYRQLLTKVYKECNPLKLADIETLLTKYKGHEEELYLNICKRYKVAPTFDFGLQQPVGDQEDEHEEKAPSAADTDAEDGSALDAMIREMPTAASGRDAKDVSALDAMIREMPTAISGSAAKDGAVGRDPEQMTLAVSVGAAREEEDRKVWEWLSGLDNNRGALLEYFEIIQREFDSDFAQISAARLPAPKGPGLLAGIDPSFFEVLGVKSAGHKLLLAKGIMAL